MGDSISTQPMLRLNNATVRPLQAAEIKLANRWATDEGWNPGLFDASLYRAIDPESLQTMDIGGKPVGVISTICLTDDFAFVGFFVLPPEYRRARYGWTLMQASLERCAHRVIGADVVHELIRTYSHYGMRAHHCTASFHGVAPAVARPWRPGIEAIVGPAEAALANYDQVNFGVPRGRYLRHWLALPESTSLVYRENGYIRGLGSVRRCHRGARIGPLQADNAEIAESLFDALVGFVPGEEISLDCPDNNPEAAQLARAKGLISHSETVRLYRGEPPAGRPERVFGLMSYSLG